MHHLALIAIVFTLFSLVKEKRQNLFCYLMFKIVVSNCNKKRLCFQDLTKENHFFSAIIDLMHYIGFFFQNVKEQVMIPYITPPQHEILEPPLTLSC